MLVFKSQLDGGVERRLHKNFFVRIKRYLLIVDLRHGTIWQKWKRGSTRLDEVLSFCIEEGHDATDEWCINAQNWYHKGKN